MSNPVKKLGSGVILGSAIILAGILWLLHNTGLVEFPIREWWPFILIVIGITHLFHHSRIFDSFSWIMIALGVIFLLTANDIIEKEEIWTYWPVALIILGISFLLPKGGKKSASGFHFINSSHKKHKTAEDELTTDSDRVDESTIFGSLNKRINTKNFKGGSISMLFSGAEIDLRSAELSDEGAVLDISAIFGGVELRIPDSWAVQTHTSAILGGVDARFTNTEASQGKRLIINASAVFGGIELAN